MINKLQPINKHQECRQAERETDQQKSDQMTEQNNK